ncbi:MAG: Fis family transcriptional regulator, partial [Thermoprotei archaeon]
MLSIIRILQIVKAKVMRRRLALSDISDVDGIVSAALYKRKYRNSIVVLASPVDVGRSLIIKSTKWDFVSDLPCPGRVEVRADHHITNRPCARREFYDPKAPCAALLALRALGLRDDISKDLVKIAIETDTASIESTEADLLNLAVKGAGYHGKLYLVEKLAEIGLEVLKDERVRKYIERARIVKKATEYMASRIEIMPITVVVFYRDLKLLYRYLSILLEKKGAKFTCIIVPKGIMKVRVYLGARQDSIYDSSILAKSLGGGGHRYAAGATITSFRTRRCTRDILRKLMYYT